MRDGTVAFRRVADDLEVPRAEPPALRPVMKRRSADAVHHRMKRRARRIRRGRVRPVRRHFAVRLLHGLRPRAIVVPQLVGREIFRREPCAGLEADHLEARLRERKRGHASGRAHADDDDVRRFQVSGHVVRSCVREHRVVVGRSTDRFCRRGHALIGGRHVEADTRIANEIPANEVRVAAVCRIAERALYRVRAHEREKRRLLERGEHRVLLGGAKIDESPTASCARRVVDCGETGGVRVARWREPSAERAIDVLSRARLGGARAALVGRDDARAHRGQCRGLGSAQHTCRGRRS